MFSFTNQFCVVHRVVLISCPFYILQGCQIRTTESNKEWSMGLFTTADFSVGNDGTVSLQYEQGDGKRYRTLICYTVCIVYMQYPVCKLCNNLIFSNTMDPQLSESQLSEQYD